MENFENSYLNKNTDFEKAQAKNKKSSGVKKVMLTVLMLTLTIVIALIAVVAYVTQDFTVSNNVSFAARNISAFVSVSATNAGQEVSIANPSFDILPEADSAHVYTTYVAPQYFAGKGAKNAIVYTIAIQNTGVDAFSVTLHNIPYRENITFVSEFFQGETIVTNGKIITGDETLVVKVTVILNEERETDVDVVMNLDLQVQ